jgi:hypothetical protein
MRRHEQDLAWLGPIVRDLSQLQTELFLLLVAAIKRYEPADLQQLLDEDVAAAACALASTLETSAKGVIYEHRPATRPAERLLGTFKTLLTEAGKAGTQARVEREAVQVLRRLEQSAAAKAPGAGPRAFIERLDRLLRVPVGPPQPREPEPERSRLIVP